MSKAGSDKRRLATAALVFAALGHPTRLALVEYLSARGPTSITVLAGQFSSTRQGVTKHLYVLAEAGLVEGRVEGREHMWTPNRSRLVKARHHLDLLSRDWDARLARLKAHLEG